MVPNKKDFKVPNKYVQSSENHLNISASNRYQELSKNDDIENDSNTRDYLKPMKDAESNKINLRKKCNFTQEKSRIQQSIALKSRFFD